MSEDEEIWLNCTYPFVRGFADTARVVGLSTIIRRSVPLLWLNEVKMGNLLFFL
jgi:hypothetical protein